MTDKELDQIIQSKKQDLSLPIFQNKYGQLFQQDATSFLQALKPDSVDLIFADPPYNIGNHSWDHFSNLNEYLLWTSLWLKQAHQSLKKSGSLYICGYSEIIAEILHLSKKYFSNYKWIIWYYKNKANLRNDWGRSHESILHLRNDDEFTFNLDSLRIPYQGHTIKYPTRNQSKASQYNKYGNGKSNYQTWQPHPDGARPRDVLEIPTVNNGSQESTTHPTQKPEELLRRFILASTNEGDLVVDPFSGSGTTLIAAQQLKRKWLGCDNKAEYNHISIDRFKHIKHKTIQEWINFDRKNFLRRNSI